MAKLSERSENEQFRGNHPSPARFECQTRRSAHSMPFNNRLTMLPRARLEADNMAHQSFWYPQIV